jgi:hypothetical protein
LKAVLIELTGLGSRYGFDENLIRQKLNALHFVPYQYNAFTRELRTDTRSGEANTIFIRDYQFVSERLRLASIVNLPQMSI